PEGRGEHLTVEHGADLGGRVVEVSGELDLPIPDRGDLREGPFDIVLHEVADGVKLQADAIETSGWGMGDAGCGKRRRRARPHEGPSVHVRSRSVSWRPRRSDMP